MQRITMPRVIVGYGEYDGYRLTELPDKVLAELSARYPLLIDEQLSPEYGELLVTVAIHGELSRRGTGAKQERRVPTLSELAQKIVNRGFQQASKDHHPGGKGHHEAQLLLKQARDELLKACRNLTDDHNDESTMIMEAPEKPKSRAGAMQSEGISDDDVPFLERKGSGALTSRTTGAFIGELPRKYSIEAIARSKLRLSTAQFSWRSWRPWRAI
jgi:hypothetical protein